MRHIIARCLLTKLLPRRGMPSEFWAWTLVRSAATVVAVNSSRRIQAEKMQAFAEEIRRRFRLPVHLWDERLTSAQANRLLRETDMSIKRRGEVVDQMAAVLILQSWMDARGG